MDKISLVIVDDDPFVCGSLRTILDAQADIEVLAVGHDGIAAEQLFDSHQPDILLTDIQMPNRTGLEAAGSILQKWPEARIVLLTTFADDEYIVNALKVGAKGYLIKQDVATIAPALRLVMNGQSVLGSEVLGRVDSLIHNKNREQDEAPAIASARTEAARTDTTSPLTALTSREYEVTELVASGLDNREIANALFVSEGTVRNTISSVLQKLDLKNRTQLAVLYYRNGQG